jgi:hypothetical protein
MCFVEGGGILTLCGPTLIRGFSVHACAVKAWSAAIGQLDRQPYAWVPTDFSSSSYGQPLFSSWPFVRFDFTSAINSF